MIIILFFKNLVVREQTCLQAELIGDYPAYAEVWPDIDVALITT